MNNKKNLVVLHLESLSNEILHQERKNLPDLFELMNQSLKLNHFFSSATSSLMAFTDFLHGNDAEIEKSTSFDDLKKPSNYNDYLFNTLQKNNYGTLGIGYPKIWRDDIKAFDMWSGDEDVFEWADTPESFLTRIREFLDNQRNSDKPFAIYIWNLLSHIVYMDKTKLEGKNFFERRSLGYQSVNGTVKYLVSILKELDLFEDTIIVGFGDHGDDLWTHGLNDGFCHGIEPFINMIWTPAFIYDQRHNWKEEYNEVVSLIDLRKTILGLLGIENLDLFEFSGIDILKSKNEFVFSRNLFANQKEDSPIKRGKSTGLKKSYAVVNRHYNLIATELGLEMYAYHIDPTNHNNLLSFFYYEGDLLDFNNRGARHAHFKKIMQEDQIRHIKDNFYKLLAALRERIEMKNNLIHQENEMNLFELTALNKIRERTYLW